MVTFLLTRLRCDERIQKCHAGSFVRVGALFAFECVTVLFDAYEVLVADHGDDVDYREVCQLGQEEGDEGWSPFREDRVVDDEEADLVDAAHEVGVGEDAVVFHAVDAECCVRPEESVRFLVACSTCLEDTRDWAAHHGVLRGLMVGFIVVAG